MDPRDALDALEEARKARHEAEVLTENVLLSALRGHMRERLILAGDDSRAADLFGLAYLIESRLVAQIIEVDHGDARAYNLTRKLGDVALGWSVLDEAGRQVLGHHEDLRFAFPRTGWTEVTRGGCKMQQGVMFA